MVSKAVMATLGIAAAGFALPAAAQVDTSAFYAGFTVGQADYKGACDGVSGGGVSCDEKDTAWRLLGGYQFTPNIAVEIGYADLGEAKATAGTSFASVATTLWEIDGVGSLPFANQFSGYAKLGLYEAKTKSRSDLIAGADESNSGVTWGLGVQWDATRNIGARLEWQQYRDVGGDVSGKGNVNMLNVGVIYRFR